MYKPYLALNNLQWLIYHKTKPNQTKPKSKNSSQTAESQINIITVGNHASSLSIGPLYFFPRK